MPAPSETIDQLLLLVGRIDGKMDLVVSQSAEHEHRLSALEAWKNKFVGLALAMGAVAGGVTSKIAPLIGGAVSGH